MAGVAALVMAAPQVAAAQEPLPEAVGVVSPPDEGPVVSPQSSSEVVIGEDGGYDLDPPMAPLPDEPDEVGAGEGEPLEDAGLDVPMSSSAIPSAPTLISATAADTDSMTPSLTAQGDDFALTAEFRVRVAGASSWNIANGASVDVNPQLRGRFRLEDGDVRIAQGFDRQARVCGGGGCSDWSTVRRDFVNPAVGAGARRNDTTIGFPVGDDRLSVGVNVGTGALQIETTDLTLPGAWIR